MKRIIMLSVVLVMMFISIGECWVGFDVDDRGGRGGGHDDSIRGHDRD